MRRLVRSQIFVGFPACLSLIVLICSFSVFVNIVSPVDAHSLGRGGERAGENYPCTEGISRSVHGAMGQSKTQPNTCLSWVFLLAGGHWFLSLHDCMDNSASPAEFEGTKRGLKR